MDPDLWAAEVSAITMDEDILLLEEVENGWRGELTYTFRNRTSRLISLENCVGSFGVRLDKREGDEWIQAWSPARFLCLSPPIEIRPGGALVRDLSVFAGRPDSDRYPRFAVDEIEGTYRLVVTAAYWDYDHGAPSRDADVPLDARSSHPFEIRIRD